MNIKTFIIDAFTDEQFKGNPAGVCLLDAPLDPSLMQSIANELNFAETAFLVQDKNSPTNFAIRYFSPTVEVPFCGHATLASSKLALDRLHLPKANFNTHFGLHLEAVKDGELIRMKFPLYDTVEFAGSTELFAALTIDNPVATRYSPGGRKLLIEVADRATLAGLTPDSKKLLAATEEGVNVSVTTRSTDNEFDFYSRVFCPWMGIDEDPVTGAAHTVLAKYWSDKLGKKTLRAWQSSKRGGYMHLNILGDHELEVKSNARVVLEGMMEIADQKKLTMIIDTLKTLFDRDLVKLRNEIALYRDEQNLWKVEAGIANSAGNLCLHLVGNLNAYIGVGLAKTGYVRHRDLEFSSKNIPRDELISSIETVREVVRQGLSALRSEDLTSDFPVLVLQAPTEMEYSLLHLFGHLNYHLGQINYQRRLLDN